MKKAAVYLSLCLLPSVLSAATGYWVHNLVADAATTATADFVDPRIVNAWGNVASATSPFWVCDGGTGLSTIYTVSPTNTTALGTPNATTQPTVPGAGGRTGGVGKPNSPVCTGIVANTAPATTPPTFPVTAPGKNPAAASFIFVTADGVLSAWSGGADATQAFVEQDNSGKAVYYGLALTTSPVQLYAANFKTGGIDVFDAQFKPVTLASGAFTDPKVPAGYGPFNIWNIGGKLYVAYAQQDANKVGWVNGAGAGYVSVFDTSGKLLQSLVAGGSGSKLNAPWGMAIAPATFGKYANDLLVGNFGDGTINAYDPTTGAYVGTLQDQNGKNIVIPGLWSLLFGNGASGGDKDTLYFTAGPNGQQGGLLGSISANPNLTAVVNGAQANGGIAPNTLIQIRGNNLAATKRAWATKDFAGGVLPTSIDGLSVTINGEPAFIEYVSPVALNVVTPADMQTSGSMSVVVNDNGLTSTASTFNAQFLSPAMFLNGNYVAAAHLNGSPVGPTTLVPNASTPAAPNETIVIFGTGFGTDTTPGVPNGVMNPAPVNLSETPAVLINNVPAKVTFAGMTIGGIFQFNVVVPTGLPDGDNPVVISNGGYSTPALVLTSIKN